MSANLAKLTAALAGRYAIERELGAGGMATVYLAHDVRHDRRVALKVLRPELSAILGADRFLHEIKTTANLQHPHILSLFDSGEADGLVFYVMPYVEGESLRDRLSREHQLPVDDALRIAREVADALQYAHQHGVVHRDIKPENILLHGGHAMVADFGIALAASRSDGGTRMTETGMSLGTPHYMSPEQAMGDRDITAKTDVYALGCVLYEMLLGEPPFTGPTAQAIVAKVMTEEPRPITIHRRSVPPHVEAAVMGALEKLPADRFASAAAFIAALGDSRSHLSTPQRLNVSPSQRLKISTSLPWAIALVATLAAAGLGARALSREPGAPPLRMSIPIPSENPPLVMRLSPDGSVLAFVTSHGDELAIHTRRLDQVEPRRLDGTNGAFMLSWSPDGRWISFLAGNTARKIPASGGAAVPIPVQGGAVLQWIEWLDNETFVVQTGGGLARLGTDGRLSYFYQPDSSAREQAVALEQVLPDGRVLGRYWRVPPNGPIAVFDPRGGAVDTLLDVDAAWANYSDGILAWTLADGTMYAAPTRLRSAVTGGGRPLGAVVFAVRGFTAPATMSGGSIAYSPTRERSLVRVTREGRSSTLIGGDRTWHSPKISPDGRLIALDFSDQQRDVWLLDIADTTLTRFGFDSSAHDPQWLPDGSGVLFGALRGPVTAAFIRRLHGGRVDSVLRIGEQFTIYGVTRDGRTGIGVAISSGAFDILATRFGERRIDTLLGSQYNEGFPALSPDDRLLAYASDESGRNEVYVRRWPDMSGRLQVSQSGGSEPVWSRDGRELFYRSAGGARPMLVSATIDAGPMLRVRSRTELFDIASYEFATPHANYDVFPDGRSFVMVRQGRPGQLSEVVYLQNVAALLERAR